MSRLEPVRNALMVAHARFRSIDALEGRGDGRTSVHHVLSVSVAVTL